jgi:hypothetical protein
MKILNPDRPKCYSLTEEIRFRIVAYFSELYAEDDGLLGDLDQWTQRRIIDENLAKLGLILDADDPAETCYRDLIREIDTEAETGIFLVRSGSLSRHLRSLADEPGISGKLNREIIKIAPVVFPEQTSRSTVDLIMNYMNDDADSSRDMTHAMRSLLYASHEDVVRRRCNLPLLLDEREHRELRIMVGELAVRSGSYEKRVREIRKRARTVDQ